MDVGKLVAKQLVVDLHGVECDCQGRGDFRHLFNQLASLIASEVEQFGRMTLEHQHGPAREELVIM